MRGTNFGSGDIYNVQYPDGRVFAFSPYEMIITGTGVGQEVIVTFNGVTIKRYTNASNAATMPLSGIFKSFFSSNELGDVLPRDNGVYSNASSKLMVKDASIRITIDGYYVDILFDIIWGALQIGEIEPIEEYIYVFGLLPVTFTNTHTNSWNNIEPYIDSRGKDFDIAAMLIDLPNANEILIYENGTNILLKTYNLIKTDCTDGVYLRWIDIHGDYHYYLYAYGGEDLSSKTGATFNHYAQTLTPSDCGLLKGKTQVKNKQVGKTIRCGEDAADDNKTVIAESLSKSIKQWVYTDSNWVEVNIGDMTISRERLDGGRQINIKVVFPEYYTQSL